MAHFFVCLCDTGDKHIELPFVGEAALDQTMDRYLISEQ